MPAEIEELKTASPPLGVLLMAYGSPLGLDEVEPYYTDIRRGRKPSPEQLAELTERYRAVGGRTPLLEISTAQAAGLQRLLGDDYRVFLGMKHWHPYIRQAVAEMRGAGVRRGIGIVLAPHYSRGSIGEYIRLLDAAREELEYPLQIEVVSSWHMNPHYLNALEAHIREKLQPGGESRTATVVFTAHSLPQRIAADGDPYFDQLMQTSRALASRLGLGDHRWCFSFQSAGRTPEPWLGPDLLETVDRLAGEGVEEILVAPIGFIADHLEIFYDIDHEAREAAGRQGVRLERMRSLNDDPELVAALAAVVRAHSSRRSHVSNS